MTVKIVELKPNRRFIDPEFNGYKLSLDNIPILHNDLEVSVDRTIPDSNNYSFLHAKLIGLHNHLVGEIIKDTNVVYFIEEPWTIKKVILSNNSESELNIINVLKIPRYRNKTHSDYNVSLKLINDSLAIFSDGLGKLYILETNNRIQNHNWKCLYSEFILDNHQPFIIQDARFQKLDKENKIHCLLYSIQKKQDNKPFSSVLYWVILTEGKDNTWEKTEIKEITSSTNNEIHYAYLEVSCVALYIISDGCFEFVRNIGESTIEKLSDTSKKKYCWSQTLEDITIKFKLPNNANMDSIHINTEQTKISIIVNGQNILKGDLYHKIDNNLTNWSAENGLLEVRLFKQDEGHTWTSLILGDDSGEYIVDPALVAEIQNKLGHLCSETEVAAPLGTTFNSQQVEECDFEEDKYTTFQRLSSVTYEMTHKVNVNTHTIVLTVEKNQNSPPALALRHDVDAFIWQPTVENDETFSFVHEGTLNAFGYVQASKQQRKFSVCAPDLSYCAICESSRHLFIYRQQKAVNCGELRNRTTGKRIGHIAQQQVVNIGDDDEILGIYAAIDKLFLLTTKRIYVLKL